MADLVPIPLNLQLRRAFLEYEREGQIFHLPKEKFFSGLPGLDTSVLSNGHRAATPLGPAAGPHTQMLQNIVLCWLAGSRVIELKTVQVLDELKIPRPCIDSVNVTYNVEWSQELKLEESLREYVSASMFLEILKASDQLGNRYPTGCDETIFDMSAGYNLEGIRSPRVRTWLEGMKDATRMIDELRTSLTGQFRHYRDLAFNPRISDTITLSTFHGCPPEEIEGIVKFLLTDMGLHVCVKMNPTLLGKEEVAHLLHDVLGYKDIELSDAAFEQDLKFQEAMDMLPRLDGIAKANGRQLSVKFSNTLVVRNHRNVFHDELMYMSGPALHVLTLNLVKKFRERMGGALPLSFSAGLNAQNVSDIVAMNFVPVTTCTDLLKVGGYGRLHKYMENLGSAMQACHARSIPEFVLLHAGQGVGAIDSIVESLRDSLEHCGALDSPSGQFAESWIRQQLLPTLKSWVADPKQTLRSQCENLVRMLNENRALLSDPRLKQFVTEAERMESALVNQAGLLNTPAIVAKANGDQRYRWEQNKASPRKIGTDLTLYDCIACDKCVAVCPNAANFVLETPTRAIAYSNYELHADGTFTESLGGFFEIKKSHQFANYADACNDCGNCDTACPESGGPNVGKPRFFGSRESFARDARQNGFFVETNGKTKVMHAVIAGEEFTLIATAENDRFNGHNAEFTIQSGRNQLINWRMKNEVGEAKPHFDMLPYLQMRFLMDAIFDSRHINYINVLDPGVTK